LTFQAAQQIADVVLYEGYVLYPYRASSDKNRVRFQFGVLAPRAQAERDGSENWEMQTECLISPAIGGSAGVDVRVRCLQLQTRRLEMRDPAAPGGFRSVASLDLGDEELVAWDEAVEQTIDIDGRSLAALLASGEVVPIALPGGREEEPIPAPDGGLLGRIVRTRWPIEGRVVLGAERADELVRLRVRIENLTNWSDPSAARDETLSRSLLGCHTLLGVMGGSFVSLTDPPVDAVAAAKGSRNLNTWPVLVGETGSSDVVLSSPIILPDHPEIAPESPGDLFDATEIDEILTLRIMTLTDEEKRSARATDPRARRIIDRADAMPPEMMDRLHGAIRYLRGGPAGPLAEAAAAASAVPAMPAMPQIHYPDQPPEPGFPTIMTTADGQPIELPPSVWQPEARVAPELASVEIRGVAITKGSQVRLLPVRRADSMDFFLLGKVATVEAVFESVDDETFVAVTIDDDPASDVHRAAGRYFYFQPDELEPVDASSVEEVAR